MGIFWKYFIAYSATVTVVILALAIFMSATIRGQYHEAISGDLKKYVPFAGQALKDTFGTPGAEMDHLIKELSRQTTARITLIATDGTVLGDSEKDPALMENHYARPEVQDALEGRIGESARHSVTLGEEMSYVAIPVIDNGEVKGIVRLSLKIQAVELLVRMITSRIVLFSMIAWGVALILTFFSSRVFSSWVKQMVDLTKQFAGGDFSNQAVVKSRDELGELAAGLNDMSQKLQSSFTRLQTQHDELDAIIDSMTAGVLVLDSRLNVRLANNSLKQMFAIKGDLQDRSYTEVIRSVAITQMVDELSTSDHVERRRIEQDSRIIMGNGIALMDAEENAGSYVLVFHDITSDAQLENMKAEFAANASHELRTPLAAIKGYLETFEEEDTETQQAFIQIIRRNVDRINNLVSDLLLLSRLESPAAVSGLEKANLLSIAEDVMKLIERLARGKNIELKVDIEPGIVINGDPFLLEQMLLNLLDNAVKYTESGEVILRARQVSEKIVIQVLDTGMGIPKEHMPRIFERFYRVDRARSRKLGGTGLGLSIVKHIVQLHHGEIHVESRPAGGTDFTIYIPNT